MHREARLSIDDALSSDTASRLIARGINVETVARAGAAIVSSLRSGGKLVVFGNGGSAADAQHIAAEFVGRFVKDRRPLAALALTTDSSGLTAIGNDFGFREVFARQVVALGRHSDVVLAISTSGRSENVLRGVDAARSLGMLTIGLSGAAQSPLSDVVDISIRAPGDATAEVQESHLAIEHAICAIVERLYQAETPITLNPNRVVPLPELVSLRERWRSLGLTVVWTNGCYDLLHTGHLSSFEAARKLGDVLVVGVNGDESVRKLKGDGRPVTPDKERAALVASLRPVDWVTVFDETTPERVLSLVRPDIHCKGAEYAVGGRPMPERELVESFGGCVVYLPLTEGRSTTQVIRRIRGDS